MTGGKFLQMHSTRGGWEACSITKANPLSRGVLSKLGASAGDPGFNTAWEALALLVALRLWFRGACTLATRVKSDNVRGCC